MCAQSRCLCGLLLDDCSFGAPCCCEHDPGGEADSQVLLLQAQQLGAVLQSLTGLVLDGAAACETRRRANIKHSYCQASEAAVLKLVRVFSGLRNRKIKSNCPGTVFSPFDSPLTEIAEVF